MEGVVTKWNPIDWVGLIESDGKSYIVKRQNMKRGTALKVGGAARRGCKMNLLDKGESD